MNMGQPFCYSLQSRVDSFFLRQGKELQIPEQIKDYRTTVFQTFFFLQFIHSKIDRTEPCKHFLCEWAEIIHNLHM